MKNSYRLLLIGAVFLTGTLSAAPVIVSAGSATEANWFTAGYGDHAYAFFNDAGGPGGVVFKLGGEFGGEVSLSILAAADEDPLAGSANLEDPAGGTFQAGAVFNFGLNASSGLQNLVSLTFNTGTPPELRIGVLVGAGEVASGAPTDFPMDVGVGGVSQSVTNPGVNRADWYFFDVTNIAAGESVNLQSTWVADASAHRFSPVSGVAIQVIPEPGTLALVGLALAGLLLFRRRR